MEELTNHDGTRLVLRLNKVLFLGRVDSPPLSHALQWGYGNVAGRTGTQVGLKVIGPPTLTAKGTPCW